MKGLKPINTVANLMAYLGTCNPEAKIMLMPEDGDGFPIGGVLDFPAEGQTWILFDEFEALEPTSERMEWSGGPPDDDDLEEPIVSGGIVVLPSSTEDKEDVVQIRGALRSA